MLATQKRTFNINSKKRLNGTSSSFNYELKMPPDAHYDQVVVLSASIPKSFYMIQQTYNTLILTEGKDSAVCTIPEGTYELPTFMTVIETELNAQSAAELNGWIYSVATQDPQLESDTGKLVFSVSGNSSQPSFTFPSTSQLYEQFGFEKESTNVFVGDNLTSVNCYNLQRESTLFIRSNMIANEDDDTLVEINANASPDFSRIIYQCTAPELYSKNMQTTGSSYHFTLTNEDGIEMDLHGQDLQLTICCYKRLRTLENIDRYIASTIIEQFEQRKVDYLKRSKEAETSAPDETIEEEDQPAI